MGFLKRYSVDHSRGSALIDVILAIALASMMIGSLASISAQAESIYAKAKERRSLIYAYMSHEQDSAIGSLMPGRSYSIADPSGIDVGASAKAYGDRRVEIDVTMSYAGQTDDPRHIPVAIRFARIKADPKISGTAPVGMTMCSADMDMAAPVGSSAFFASTTGQSKALVTAISLPIDPLLPLTDLEVRDRIAYVSADSSIASDPDFMAFDVSDPDKPSLIGSIDTGPGIAAITVAGDKAYVAANSRAYQLHVIGLNGLAPPVLLARYSLPLPEASTTPAAGSAIAYRSGAVYLGTDKWDGDEVSIIDVSDMESMEKIGGYDVGSKVNDISVGAGQIYVAASDQFQLVSLEASESGDMARAWSFSPSGWQRQQGKSIAMFEGSLTLGRTSGGFDIASDHELFNWPRGTDIAPVSLNVPGGVYGVISDRRRVYTADRSYGGGLSIFHLPFGHGASSTVSLPVSPKAMACDRSYLYVLAGTAPVIYEAAISSRHDSD